VQSSESRVGGDAVEDAAHLESWAESADEACSTGRYDVSDVAGDARWGWRRASALSRSGNARKTRNEAQDSTQAAAAGEYPKGVACRAGYRYAAVCGEGSVRAVGGSGHWERGRMAGLRFRRVGELRVLYRLARWGAGARWASHVWGCWSGVFLDSVLLITGWAFRYVGAKPEQGLGKDGPGSARRWPSKEAALFARTAIFSFRGIERTQRLW